MATSHLKGLKPGDIVVNNFSGKLYCIAEVATSPGVRHGILTDLYHTVYKWKSRVRMNETMMQLPTRQELNDPDLLEQLAKDTPDHVLFSLEQGCGT